MCWCMCVLSPLSTRWQWSVVAWCVLSWQWMPSLAAHLILFWTFLDNFMKKSTSHSLSTVSLLISLSQHDIGYWSEWWWVMEGLRVLYEILRWKMIIEVAVPVLAFLPFWSHHRRLRRRKNSSHCGCQTWNFPPPTLCAFQIRLPTVTAFPKEQSIHISISACFEVRLSSTLSLFFCLFHPALTWLIRQNYALQPLLLSSHQFRWFLW